MRHDEAYAVGFRSALEKAGVDWRTVASMGGLGALGAGVGAMASDNPLLGAGIGAGIGAGVGAVPHFLSRSDWFKRLVKAKPPASSTGSAPKSAPKPKPKSVPKSKPKSKSAPKPNSAQRLVDTLNKRVAQQIRTKQERDAEEIATRLLKNINFGA